MTPPLALTVLDALVLYLVPFGILVFAWLSTALVVYLAVRSRRDFAFKHDLLRKYEEKRLLPSGAPRLSYGLVARLLAGDNAVQATFLYRVSRFLAQRRMRLPAEVVHAVSKLVTHVDISPWSEIGPGFYLYHGLGTVIGKGTRVGARALVCQGVTTGGGPVLGDDVKLWAGAKVIGRLSIGDRAEIGANAVVVGDVPPDCIAVGVPATRFIARDSAGLARPTASAAVEARAGE